MYTLYTQQQKNGKMRHQKDPCIWTTNISYLLNWASRSTLWCSKADGVAAKILIRHKNVICNMHSCLVSFAQLRNNLPSNEALKAWSTSARFNCVKSFFQSKLFADLMISVCVHAFVMTNERRPIIIHMDVWVCVILINLNNCIVSQHSKIPSPKSEKRPQINDDDKRQLIIA